MRLSVAFSIWHVAARPLDDELRVFMLSGGYLGHLAKGTYSF